MSRTCSSEMVLIDELTNRLAAVCAGLEQRLVIRCQALIRDHVRDVLSRGRGVVAIEQGHDAVGCVGHHCGAWANR